MLKSLTNTIRLALMLTFVVIVLGAYTRLKDAGLGCPDWPGCYGKIIAPATDQKAWIEMIHRYVAGSLGLLILFSVWQAFRLRNYQAHLLTFAVCTFAVVIFQALLGMWTVTLTLNPLVVMGHLLGGITLLALLWWLFLKINCKHNRLLSKLAVESKVLGDAERRTGVYTLVYEDSSTASTTQFAATVEFGNRILIYCSLVALICQIALGGWTSANYSALVCADFPTCQGHIWPAMDWQHAFAIPGVPLENSARVTIQMAHRIGAMITAILLFMLALKLFNTKYISLKIAASVLLLLLVLQIILGISNVLLGLPIIVSLAHNATAVLLLLCLLYILFVTNAKIFCSA